jgi:hypothetical protein
VRGTHKLDNAEGRANDYMEIMCESFKRLIIETSAWNVDYSPSFNKGYFIIGNTTYPK